MPRPQPLRDAHQLLVPAIERSIAALDLSPEHDGLVAVARLQAATIDRMSNAEQRAMLGQTLPGLQRSLIELDRRAQQQRTALTGRPQTPTLDRLRAARRA